MNLRNQEGQSIVAVIMIMFIALGIGITLSARNVNTLRQRTNQSSSDRALSVAEASVERILTKDYQDLIDYINFDSCGSECVLDIYGDDGVLAHSDVTLSVVGASSDPHEVKLDVDSAVEVVLDTYPSDTSVFVCWNYTPSGDRPSVVGSLLSGTLGDYSVSSFAYNSVGSLNSSNGFDSASPDLGYDNCFTVYSGTNPVGLRLKSVYNDVVAFVIPNDTTTLPPQGVLIKSVGEVLNSQRTVEVLLSRPFLPAVFDYVLYQKSTDTPLSN